MRHVVYERDVVFFQDRLPGEAVRQIDDAVFVLTPIIAKSAPEGVLFPFPRAGALPDIPGGLASAMRIYFSGFEG